ncbi:hypothetical protein ACVW0P_004384 [Mucilaginibacter sp. UYNi724]
MENNWKFKTLRNLEKIPKYDSGQPSYLVKRCNELLDQPLNDFSVEDIRIMVGQQIGLDYLVPLSFDYLNSDILAEGDYYPGDLLTAMLKVDSAFWDKNRKLFNELAGLVKINYDLLIEPNVSPALLKQFY